MEGREVLWSASFESPAEQRQERPTLHQKQLSCLFHMDTVIHTHLYTHMQQQQQQQQQEGGEGGEETKKKYSLSKAYNFPLNSAQF